MYILLNGIAAGMSGLKKIGTSSLIVTPEAPRVSSAEELFSILRANDVNGGVISK